MSPFPGRARAAPTAAVLWPRQKTHKGRFRDPATGERFRPLQPPPATGSRTNPAITMLKEAAAQRGWPFRPSVARQRHVLCTAASKDAKRVRGGLGKTCLRDELILPTTAKDRSKPKKRTQADHLPLHPVEELCGDLALALEWPASLSSPRESRGFVQCGSCPFQ